MEKENKAQLVMERSFRVDKTTLFKALTGAEHIPHWWAPPGFELEVLKLDLRPGGIFHYRMKNASGIEMFAVSKYMEIVPNEKIVFTNAFADENGKPIPAPFEDTWPVQILYTFTLSENKGKTTLHLHGIPYEANDIETETFINGIPSMNEGFGNSFKQLETHLATL